MKNHHLPENRQIYLVSINGPEIEGKIKLKPFSLVLHQNIDLTGYGSQLRRLYLTFLIISPDDEHHMPFEDYEAEDQEADVAIVIPYDQVLAASPDEVVCLLEQACLEGIDQLATLPIPDFDTADLKLDVEAIFRKEGWQEALV